MRVGSKGPNMPTPATTTNPTPANRLIAIGTSFRRSIAVIPVGGTDEHAFPIEPNAHFPKLDAVVPCVPLNFDRPQAAVGTADLYNWRTTDETAVNTLVYPRIGGHVVAGGVVHVDA